MGLRQSGDYDDEMMFDDGGDAFYDGPPTPICSRLTRAGYGYDF